MSLETATYIDSLVTSNPQSSDQGSTIDDHLRLIKASLKRTFPNVSGEVSVSHGELNYLRSATSNIQAQINAIKQGLYSANYALSASTAVSAGYAGSASRAGYAESAGYAASAGFANIGTYEISAVARYSDLEYSISVSNSTMLYYPPSLSMTLDPGTYRFEAMFPAWGVSATGAATLFVRLNSSTGPQSWQLLTGVGGNNGSATALMGLVAFTVSATAVVYPELQVLYAAGPDHYTIGSKAYVLAMKMA